MLFRRLLTSVEDLIFARVCAGCAAPLGRDPGESGANWRKSCCESCAAELDIPPRPGCRRCGADVGPNLESLGDCGFCRGERYRFARTWRIGVYDGPLRRAVLRAKRRTDRVWSRTVAGLLWERHGPAMLAENPGVVVAVPHLWWQSPWVSDRPADILAEVLANRMRIPQDRGLLRKTRWIPRQTTLTPGGRRSNVRGAFVADRRVHLNGATVMLTDDVLTTGATANECARALERIGAGRVIVAVFARGLGRRGLVGE